MIFFSVSHCKVKVTPEPAVQISRTQINGYSRDTCMAIAMKSNPKISKLPFCDGESFCGLDIRPELTSKLTFLSAKDCEILVQNINICESLQNELEFNGECENC